jgi:tetratricopeptide (TPR) repeat protein
MKHLIAIAILAVVGLHRPALADDPKAVAKQHIAAAKSFHEQRRFADALAALEAAYALDPQPQLLFAMGQLNVRLGRCERAIMFYERFVATKPKPEAAALATEAIETCKTAPPPPEPAPSIEKPRAPLAVPLVTSATPPVVDVPATPASVAPARVGRRPWYTNYVADGLVLAGVASAVASVVVYQGARADRDRADAAPDYATYEDLIDGAQRKRTYAIALGAAGAASAIAGGLYFVMGKATRTRDHVVGVAPSRGGGVVSWGGRF